MNPSDIRGCCILGGTKRRFFLDKKGSKKKRKSTPSLKSSGRWQENAHNISEQMAKRATWQWEGDWVGRFPRGVLLNKWLTWTGQWWPPRGYAFKWQRQGWGAIISPKWDWDWNLATSVRLWAFTPARYALKRATILAEPKRLRDELIWRMRATNRENPATAKVPRWFGKILQPFGNLTGILN